MPRHVAVVFVHGILAENDNYDAPMRLKLRDKLKDLEEHLHFQTIYWATEIRNHQREFMETAGIAYTKLRKMVVQGLGDAAAYQKTSSERHSAYHRIQGCINLQLDHLVALGHPKMPLIFIGHSLGCHIISSYVWDMNQLRQKTSDEIKHEPDWIKELWNKLQMQNSTPFRRLGTLAGIVTFGSNIPLFTFAFGQGGFCSLTSVHPDRPHLSPAFPGAELDSALLEKARWLNFFSKKDVLGYPLKTVDAYRRNSRIVDIPVSSEARITGYVPYWSLISAHNGYWTNKKVIDETANFIRGIVE